MTIVKKIWFWLRRDAFFFRFKIRMNKGFIFKTIFPSRDPNL